MTTDPLRQQLEAAKALFRGSTMDDFTVLSSAVDPYRLDTPANRRDAQWFASQVGGLVEIHNRGSHYISIGRIRPNGWKYVNAEEDYNWLQSASVAARWLGYVSPDRIIDERNAEPVFIEFARPEPAPFLVIGNAEIVLPEHLLPRASLDDFRGVQEYHLALFGEKTSLRSVLEPLAQECWADLLLPTGNSSNTMITQLAKKASEQGRRLIVFYFSDCDPSGWNMSVEVARKLQAEKTIRFPDLDFELRPVALTPDQVRKHNLPSDPLKDTEKRAVEWEKAMGVEQTEIDSLATLKPDVLDEIAREAIEPFFDRTLASRVEEARAKWVKEAQEKVVSAIGSEKLEMIESESQRRLAQIQRDAESVNDLLRVELPDDFSWPETPDLPLAEPPADVAGAKLVSSLIDSSEDWATQTLKLKAHKEYQQMAVCQSCGGPLAPSRAKKSNYCSPECLRDSMGTEWP